MNIKPHLSLATTSLNGPSRGRAADLAPAERPSENSRPAQRDTGPLAEYRAFAGKLGEDIGAFIPPNEQIKEALENMMTPAKAARVLLDNFDYLDNIKGSKTKKKIFSVDDLKLALQDQNCPKELRRAIEFLLANPKVISEINTAGADPKDDGLFGRQDLVGTMIQHALEGLPKTGFPIGKPGGWPVSIPGLPPKQEPGSPPNWPYPDFPSLLHPDNEPFDPNRNAF